MEGVRQNSGIILTFPGLQLISEIFSIWNSSININNMEGVRQNSGIILTFPGLQLISEIFSIWNSSININNMEGVRQNSGIILTFPGLQLISEIFSIWNSSININNMEGVRQNSGIILTFPGLQLISEIFSIWNSSINIISLWITKSRNKSESRLEVPIIVSVLSYLWNVIFCPNKTNKCQILPGTILFQMINGGCMLNPKQKIGRMSWYGNNYILFFHPDTAQKVLRSSSLITKDSLYNIFQLWLGDCLLMSSGEKWRKRRKLLTPTFHFRILEDFQDIFNEHSNILIEKLKKKPKTEIFDMIEIVGPCAFDIINETSMKMRMNAQTQESNEYIKAINQIRPFVIQWFMKPWYWFPPIFYFSSFKRNMKKTIEIIHQFDEKIIKKRKETLLTELENGKDENKELLGQKKRRAFLDLLLDHHIKDSSFTERDIRQEMDNFMFAGKETTTLTICWALYFLGRHQDIQDKVFQELTDIFGENRNRAITTEDLKKMKYLECVIKESMRIYPPGPFIIRKCPTEMRVDEFVLPANSSLVICIYGIHHNPIVYENPEIFNPDRFLSENSKTRHSFSFIPFSAGPRNCIGQVFAIAEAKTVLANILRHFKIHSLDPRDKILLSIDIVLYPVAGLNMTIEERVTSY